MVTPHLHVYFSANPKQTPNYETWLFRLLQSAQLFSIQLCKSAEYSVSTMLLNYKYVYAVSLA